MKKKLLLIAILFQLKQLYAQQTPVNPLDHIGDTVTISGKIYGGSFLVNVRTRPTFLNLWDSVPNHRLMIRIEPGDRDKFPSAPEKFYLHKNISITGVLDNYKGSALIKISDPAAIKIQQPVFDTVVLTNTILKNKFVPGETGADKGQQLQKITTDTVLQSAWINGVANRSAFEQSSKNVRIVQKKIPLSVAPGNDAPVIGELEPGIVVAILLKSRKWSYIAVRKPDGTSSVFGFIKNRRLKHLKKEKGN